MPNDTGYITTNAKIRITDTFRLNTTNQTAAFEINQTSVEVTAPSGTETFRLGATTAISWTTGGPVSTDLKLQYYNGVIWKDIVNPVPAEDVRSKSYDWYIDPGVFAITTDSNTGQVRIVDNADIAIRDTTPGFTVLNPLITTELPKITAGGINVDECIAGEEYYIDWSTEGAVSNDLAIDIGTSSDGVSYSYTNIWDGSDPAKPFAWTPDTAADYVRIKISDNLRANDGGKSSVFKIVAAPTLTVDTPLDFVVGTSGNILKWQATEGVSKEWKIEYFIDADDSGTVSGAETLNTIESAITINTVDAEGKYNYDWSIAEDFTDISTQVKIKISDTQRGGEYNDICDNSFEIAAPSIIIDAPISTDSLTPGTEFDIEWTVPTGPVNNVKIEYSIDGAAFVPVSELEGIVNDGVVANDRIFTWLVPDGGEAGSTNVKIKISDADRPVLGKSVERQFSISVPALTIVAPVGGTWVKGNRVDIIYKAVGNLGDVKIVFSGDGGITYDEINDTLTAAYTDMETGIHLPNNSPGVNNKFSWTINKAVPASCKIKIIDNAHSTLTRAESNLFELALPTITVTGPVSSNIFVSSETQTITWISDGPITDTIRYQYTLTLIPGPSDWRDIFPHVTQAVSAATSGSIDFTVPDVDADNPNVKVRVVSVNNLASTGVSSAFEVRPEPAITLLSPDGNAVGADAWVAGVSKRVQFATVGRIGTTLEFYYSVDGGTTYNGTPFYTAADYDYNTGTGYYDWSVERAAISNNARIKIVGTNLTNGAIVNGVSAVFEIVRPQIVLVSPEGGEYWAVGDTVLIKWQPTGDVDFADSGLKIEYMNLDGAGNPVSYTTINSAADNISPYEESWTITAGDVSGADNDKKIRITDISDIQVQGTSVAGFTIIPLPIITITALSDENDQAKAEFVVGDTMRIKWDCRGLTISDNLTIEYSDDDFTTAQTITAAAAKTLDTDTADGVYSGTLDWAIPEDALVSANIKLKVYDPANTGISDTYGPFRIRGGFEFRDETTPAVPFLSTTEWKAGTVHSLKWYNKGSFANIKLEYATSEDGITYGAYTQITSSFINTPDADNISTYANWTVPDANMANVLLNQGALDNPPEPAETYHLKLKISDVSDPTIYEEQVFKAGYFTISWKIKDYDLLTLLDELTVKTTKAGVTYWNKTGDSLTSISRVHTRRLPYGIYTTYISKSGYIERADSDRLVNADMEVTILLESTISAQMEYKVMSNYSYREDNDTLKVSSWLEKKGTLVAAEDIDLGRGGNAWIKIYDGETLVKTLSASLPDLNGTYWFTLDSPSGLEGGKTYFARAGIFYRNREYISGASFEVTVSQRLQELTEDIKATLQEEVAEIKASLDTQTDTISTKVEEESDVLGGQMTQVATQLALAETAIKSKVGEVLEEAQVNLPAKIADVKSQVSQVLTATGTALPAQITTLQETLGDEFKNVAIKSQLLTRETVVKSGDKITIRYRTNKGLHPEVDVYNSNGVMKAVDAGMSEIGTTGIYEYGLTFETAWGTGDFTVVCSENTQGVMDSIVITVVAVDIEDVAGQVSSVLGTTVGLTSEAEVLEELGTQLDMLQKAIENLGTGTGTGTAPLLGPVSTGESGGQGSGTGTGTDEQLSGYYDTVAKIEENVKGLGELKNYKLEELHSLSEEQTGDIKKLRNKVMELKNMLELNKKLLENIGTQPVVQSWFEWGSVIMKLLAVNPSPELKQTVPIKGYLPKGIKPEDVIEINDLELLYDVTKGAYYVYREFELAPGETVTRDVRMKDVWRIPEEDLADLKELSKKYAKIMQNTDYYDKANFLKNSVESKITEILERQNRTPTNPMEHIINYHENQKLLTRIRADIAASESLAAQATKITPVATWRMIIVIIVFLGVLSLVFFAIWHKQLRLIPAGNKSLFHVAAPGGIVMPMVPQKKEAGEEKKVELSDIKRLLSSHKENEDKLA
ncbi:MAG: hypothetical protein ABH952_07780 [Candidatus Omnitrophota bacterium]